MSRSFKLNIIKESPRNYKKSTNYWKKVRRVLKNRLRIGDENNSVKDIVNDYDYSDYKFINNEIVPK